MRRMGSPIAIAAVVMLVGASPASAANKEQQILMAELRMMQQQQQQLQQMVATLADSLKAVTAKMDEQAATSRKALADQRLLVEGMTDTVRALREKADDTNVRLSSMTHELESIRQTIAALPPPAAVTAPAADPSADPAAVGTPSTATTGAPAPPPNVSPQRTYESAYSDFTGGQWDLAIEGFQTFLKYFPRHPNADDAQLNIGNALYNAGKYPDAVREYQKVISDYPKAETVPEAYYKLGLSYAALKQIDLARKSLETVTQTYKGSSYSTLANQALGRLPKQD